MIWERCTRTCEIKGGTTLREGRQQGGRWSCTRVIRVGRLCSQGQKFRVRQSEQVTLATMCQSLTCSPHCLNSPELKFLEHQKASWELRSKHHHPTTSSPVYSFGPFIPPYEVNTRTMISKHIHNASTHTHASIRQTPEQTRSSLRSSPLSCNKDRPAQNGFSQLSK